MRFAALLLLISLSAEAVCRREPGRVGSIGTTELVRLAKASHSLLEFVGKLPRELRSRAALAYHSESTQFASPAQPRVVLFADDASLLVAYSGNPDPKAKGAGTAETISFDFDKCDFVFRSFDFPRILPTDSEQRHSGVTRVDESGKRCFRCHEGLPIWDTYSLWPGFYGSYDDGIRAESVEGHFYEQFQKQSVRKGLYEPLIGIAGLKKHFTLGRYTRDHSLKPNRAYYTTHVDTDLFTVLPVGSTGFGPDYENGARPLEKLSFELVRLNTSRIAHELENANLGRDLDLALLAAFSDCSPQEDFMPPSLVKGAVIAVPRLESELKQRANDYHAKKLARLKPFVWPMDGREKNFELRPHVLHMKARVAYLLSVAGLDAEHWSLARPREAMMFMASNSALELIVPYLGESARQHDPELAELGFNGDGIWAHSCKLLRRHFVVE